MRRASRADPATAPAHLLCSERPSKPQPTATALQRHWFPCAHAGFCSQAPPAPSPPWSSGRLVPILEDLAQEQLLAPHYSPHPWAKVSFHPLGSIQVCRHPITNGPKQHRCILLWSWRSGVPNRSPWAEVKVLSGRFLVEPLRGESISSPFSASRGHPDSSAYSPLLHLPRAGASFRSRPASPSPRLCQPSSASIPRGPDYRWGSLGPFRLISPSRDP